MRKNEENQENKQEMTWDGLAMEIIAGRDRISRSKNIVIIVLAIALIVAAVGSSYINYRNDEKWRELFGKYDFVTQDGQGYNYYNSGINGDVSNGAEDSTAEESE